MKLKLPFLLFLCPIFAAVGQEKNMNDTGDALHIGDRVPDMIFSPVINYPSKSIWLSAFKGKLIILDFWASYCPPCLHLLPDYQALQKQLPGKVQFVLVTAENSQTALASLNRLHINLPSVIADRSLYKLFPHTSITHEVWIWDNKVAAITFGEEVTRDAILKITGGQAVAIDQKHDDLNFDALRPLLVNGNGGRGEVYYQSIITPYIAGLNSLTGFQKTEERIISVALNSSVLALYQQAFSHVDPLLELNNRYILDLPDPVKDKIDRGKQLTFHTWITKYGFCYSLVLPPEYKGDISKTMETDLNRFFGTKYHISAGIEKLEVDCLVLSRIPGSPSLESSGGNPIFSVTDTSFVQKNLPVQSLVMELARRYRKLSTPFIDETGYRVPVDLAVKGNMSELETLKKELLRSGLQIREMKRTIDMVVIKPVTTPKPN